VAKAPSKTSKPPEKAGLVGPLYAWELVRLARRGQDARARFILAFSLFLVLTAFSLIWFRNSSPLDLFLGESQTLSIRESSRFGESFSLTFVLAQLGILTLLTPAYAAGGIAEEKDRRTLIYLLMSELTPREIVFGKFLGRVSFLIGILFAGLPILAITQLHGGVSLKFLLMSYLITASTVFLLSGISAASAASAETLRGALFRAYGLTAIIVVTGFGVFVFLSPFTIILLVHNFEAGSPEAFWIVSLAYSAFEIALGCVGVLLAVRSIRKMRARLTFSNSRPPRWIQERYRREDLRKMQEAHAKALVEARKGEPEAELLVPDDATNGRGKRIPIAPVSKYSAVPSARKARLIAPPKRPPLRRPENTDIDAEEPKRPAIGSGDPFLWKERYTQGTKRTEDDDAMKSMMYLLGGVLALIVVFFLFVSILGMMASTNTTNNMQMAKSLLMIAGGTGLFAYLLAIGTSACGTICRERQRLTLESLLTIPVPRREILLPKWKVCLHRGWWWGLPAACVLALAFAATDAPATVFLALAFVAAAIPLACSYGIWLSIRCKSVNRAVMWYLPMAGGLVLFPVMVCSWISATNGPFILAILGTIVAAAAAAAYAFWKSSERAFDRETVIAI
jgi:ABC-type transport system involved in multi-copper enzyme maturation permease subunit